MGRFEAFYASALQHPLLLWAGTALGVALCLSRRGLHPGLRRYGAALGGLSALDAWLTSSPVPGLGRLPDGLATALAFFFVLAGDLRFLLVVATGTPAGALAPTPRRLATALGLALVVPLLTPLARHAWPALRADPRLLYLVYELAFLALASALALWHPRAREAPWIRSLCGFVMLTYGLWAGADAILLATGSDLGYALRVVPNLLYYGGSVAALGWLAPALRPGETPAPRR